MESLSSLIKTGFLDQKVYNENHLVLESLLKTMSPKETNKVFWLLEMVYKNIFISVEIARKWG